MKYIYQTELSAFLDELAYQVTLIAPRMNQGVLLYQPVQGSQEVVWDYIRPVMSVKDAFFPATERLLSIQKTGQDILLDETFHEGEQVIFGVRPCDARGLRALDAIFLDKAPRDPYYAARRERTTLIGLSCNEMGETCFCTSLGGSPDDPRDMDVMLTGEGDGYRVEFITEKGSTLFDSIPNLQLSNDPANGDRRVTCNHQPDLNLQPIDWPSHFNDAYWERLADRCLSCRICGYVCPTCRCFIVRDEAIPRSNGANQFERLRCWDTCTSEAYRRVAGGHNPRAAKSQRLRNRFLCKFHYYPEQYGPIACTGCGRCIEFCPVNIDITEVLQDLAAARLEEVTQ